MDLRNGALGFAVFGLPMALAFLWLAPVVNQTIPVSPGPAQLAIGGLVTGSARVIGHDGRPLTRRAKLNLGEGRRCKRLPLAREPAGRRATVKFTGTDAYGHRVGARRKLRLPRVRG